MEERQLIRWVCRHVSRRAARISAAAISFVVTWMDPDLDNRHTIAVDCTLSAQYPQFKQTIRKTLNSLHGDKKERIEFSSSADGSGVGAAFSSAVASSTK